MDIKLEEGAAIVDKKDIESRKKRKEEKDGGERDWLGSKASDEVQKAPEKKTQPTGLSGNINFRSGRPTFTNAKKGAGIVT